MSVTLDQQLGGNDSSGVFFPLQLSPAAAVPIGDLLLVYAGASDLSTVSISDDAGGNTYSQIAVGQGLGMTAVLNAAVVAAALTTSNAITVTNTPGGGERMVAAASFSGAASNVLATVYGAASAAQNSSTTPSVATSTSVRTGDLVLGVTVAKASSGSGANYSLPSGWSALDSVVNTGKDYELWGAFEFASASGVATYQPTISDAGAGALGAPVATVSLIVALRTGAQNALTMLV